MSVSKKLLVAGLAAVGLLLSAAAAIADPGQATASVNVRSGPGTSYPVVDSLTAGEFVDVQRCQGNWCYVVHNGPDGWVSANYLDVANGAPDEPVYVAPDYPDYYDNGPDYAPPLIYPPRFHRPFDHRPFHHRPPPGTFPPGTFPPGDHHFPHRHIPGNFQPNVNPPVQNNPQVFHNFQPGNPQVFHNFQPGNRPQFHRPPGGGADFCTLQPDRCGPGGQRRHHP